VDQSPVAEQRYRARFYFDPNSIIMEDGDMHYVFAGYMTPSDKVFRVILRYSAGSYQLQASLYNNSGATFGSEWFTLENNWTCVEIDWRAATQPDTNDGGLTLWLDGVQEAEIVNVANGNLRVETVRLGAVSGIDDGTRGMYYFDAFESRTTTYIGPEQISTTYRLFLPVLGR
jgi:hypothetical protein